MYFSISLDLTSVGPSGESKKQFAERAKKIETLAPDFVFLVSEDAGGIFQPPLLEALVNIAWVTGILKTPVVVAGLPGLHSLPYHVARALSAADFISGGRAAWCPVLTDAQRFESAQNILNDFDLSSSQMAMDRVGDFINASKALWDSWDQDALIINKESGAYLDSAKVRRVDYNGPQFKTMGSLNAARPPQGHPLLAFDIDSVSMDETSVEEALKNMRADVLVGSRSSLQRCESEAGISLEKVQTQDQLREALEAKCSDGLHFGGENALDLLTIARADFPSHSDRAKVGRDRFKLPYPSNPYSGSQTDKPSNASQGRA